MKTASWRANVVNVIKITHETTEEHPICSITWRNVIRSCTMCTSLERSCAKTILLQVLHDQILGNIYTDKRNRLSSEHAHQQLFLSYIYKQ
jgi:hypothetical protein